jgi:glutathionyl-hydroquinone reductase
MRMLDTEVSAFTDVAPSLYPEAMREQDELNERIYQTVNNGVYRSGFAETQQAYEAAVVPLFETLDMLEARLQGQR